jgi:hypothetical protein
MSNEIVECKTVSWEEVVPKGTPLQAIESRITEGIVSELWTGLETYSNHYGGNPVPEFHPYYKGLYVANAERIHRGIEEAVEDYRVNAFFMLLGHLNTERR